MADGMTAGATSTSAGGPVGTKVPISSSMAYDSPFLDMTSFYMPKTIKELFKFLNSIMYTDPLVSQAITKLAEYPITDLQYSDDKQSVDSEKVEKKWREILENTMNITNSMKLCGMDYYGYGTSLVSINYPFKRMLTCKCGSTQTVEAAKTIFKNYKFITTCKKCGDKGEKKAKDIPTKDMSRFGYVFWDLINIHIKYNNISGDHFFYYTIPSNITKAIKNGDMDIIGGTRLEMIEAVEKSKKLKLSPANLFHYKRPGPQHLYPEQRGWGIPVTMPVLKDIFYKRILRKGNEAIAFEHIVPLRVIFPQGTGDVSPHSMMNLSTWKDKIESEIALWKKDPNRVSIVPVPIGQINFGGDGKMLMVSQEVKMVDEDIITGIGIIPEIIKGGASWSGSNVSLRVVENTFLNHRKSMQNFIDWTVDNLSRYLGIDKISINMDDFKMADDLQRKQMLLSAATAGQISFDTVLKEMDLDPDSEYRKILDEVKKQTEVMTLKAEGQAEAQGAGSIISSMYQADAQMEGQNRMAKHQKEQEQKQEQEQAQMVEQRANDVQGEVDNMAEMTDVPVDPETGQPRIKTADLIIILTRRFANLSKSNPEEFKIRMLSMKNSTPNLYKEVYDNLSEMNLIQADLDPNLNEAQKYTPGELPSYQQGENAAAGAPSASEEGATPGVVNEAAAKEGPMTQPLPEAKPPKAGGTI